MSTLLNIFCSMQDNEKCCISDRHNNICWQKGTFSIEKNAFGVLQPLIFHLMKFSSSCITLKVTFRNKKPVKFKDGTEQFIASNLFLANYLIYNPQTWTTNECKNCRETNETIHLRQIHFRGDKKGVMIHISVKTESQCFLGFFLRFKVTNRMF